MLFRSVGPTASFIYSPTAPLAGSSVFFNATLSTAGSGHRLVSYRWSWGDGKAASSGSSVSHIFNAPGTYVVVLTVTDEAGQIARVDVEVTIS